MKKNSIQNQGNSSDDDHDYELVVLRKDGKGVLHRLPEFLQINGENEYSLVSEVYVNNGYNYGSAPSTPGNTPPSTMCKGKLRVRYEGQPGKLLIEVADCPDNYIPVQDEDTFEPDTLDRKPINKPKNCLTSEFVDSLERPQQILLRSSGSFRREPLTPCPEQTETNDESSFTRTFGSLRDIYEAKLRGMLDKVVLKGNQGEFTFVCPTDNEGRLLTLEERHCKRQRKNSNQTNNKPDVVPPPPHDESPIYERPKPPRKVIKSGYLGVQCVSSDKNSEDGTQPHSLQSDNDSCGQQVEDMKPLISASESQTSASPIYDECVIPDKNIEIMNKLTGPKSITPKTNHIVLFAQTNTPQLAFCDLSSTKYDDVTFKNVPNGFKKSVTRNLCQPWRIKLGNCYRPEDSGYLSTDSNESRFIRKRRDLDKDRGSFGGGGSETEESFGDGHSESGAESVETHSVFFDIFRNTDCNDASMDSGLVSDSRSREQSVILVDSDTRHNTNDVYSDSESVSYTTVVPFGSNVSTLSSNKSSQIPIR